MIPGSVQNRGKPASCEHIRANSDSLRDSLVQTGKAESISCLRPVWPQAFSSQIHNVDSNIESMLDANSAVLRLGERGTFK